MEGVLGKAVALPQRREGCFALQGVFPGDGTGFPQAGSARIWRRRRCPAESTAL